MKKRLLAILLTLSIASAFLPVLSLAEDPGTEGQTIYVSQDGAGDKSGNSQENPKAFQDATDDAKEGDTFIVVGQVTLPPAWGPEAPITVKGLPDQEDGGTPSALHIAYSNQVGLTSGKKPNLSLQADLTLEDILIDIEQRSNIYETTYFVAVANGHRLVFGRGVKTPEALNGGNFKYAGFVFGGGFHKEITGNTHLENHGNLLVTTFYGGGCNADVTGNTSILHTGYTQALFGGGYNGSVNGNTSITVNEGELSGSNAYFNPIIVGGGDARTADANVTGDVTIDVTHPDERIFRFEPNIYGGGKASSGHSANVGKNVEINVHNVDLSQNNASVFAGGYASASGSTAEIGGNAVITYTNANFGNLYAGGYGGSAVNGQVTIDAKDSKSGAYYAVYGGGKGQSDLLAQNKGAVNLNIENASVTLYTGGNYAEVSGPVAVNLNGTKTVRDNTSAPLTNLYNYDEKRPNIVPKGTTLTVTGDSVVTQIANFPEITITETGALREHMGEAHRLFDPDMPCVNLSLEQGGQLDLLQTNEITGTAGLAGTLILPRAAELIAGGLVTVEDGAVFDPADGYLAGDVFLKSKTLYAQGEQPEFAVTEDGQAGRYCTGNRAAETEIKHEWYVDQEAPPAPTYYTIQAGAGSGGSISPSGSIQVEAGTDKSFAITADRGYHISYVEVDGQSVGAVGQYTFPQVAGNHTIYAWFARDDQGGEPSDDPSIVYHPNFTGGGVGPRMDSHPAGRTVTIQDNRWYDREGYVFTGWNTEKDGGGRSYFPGDELKMPGSNLYLYAQWRLTTARPDDTGVSDYLNTEDHRLYMVGYPDRTFGPGRDMTRAEVAQMFYALLLDRDVGRAPGFSDVPAGAWYTRAVEAIAGLGMMKGYPDGTFRPDAPITRAEFTTTAMAFAHLKTGGSNRFTDVSRGDWFYDYVVGSIQYGWISGYPDGTFRPNRFITRAEVSVIVNNMLGRAADQRYVDRHAGDLITFPDVPRSYWAYYSIMETTNTHDYTWTDQHAERWD